MLRFIQTFVVATLLSFGLTACEDTPGETNNNDTEVDSDIVDDTSAYGWITLDSQYDGPETCTFTVRDGTRASWDVQSGVPTRVRAGVPLTVNIKGGVHPTSKAPGTLVMPDKVITVAESLESEPTVVSFNLNPTWLQETGEQWTIVDCRSVAVNDPDDRRAFTTYNGSEGVGVEDGYRLCFNVGHEVCIEFDGSSGELIDEIGTRTMIEGTLEILRGGLNFELACEGCSGNDLFTCFFDN